MATFERDKGVFAPHSQVSRQIEHVDPSSSSSFKMSSFFGDTFFDGVLRSRENNSLESLHSMQFHSNLFRFFLFGERFSSLTISTEDSSGLVSLDCCVLLSTGSWALFASKDTLASTGASAGAWTASISAIRSRTTVYPHETIPTSQHRNFIEQKQSKPSFSIFVRSQIHRSWIGGGVSIFKKSNSNRFKRSSIEFLWFHQIEPIKVKIIQKLYVCFATRMVKLKLTENKAIQTKTHAFYARWQLMRCNKRCERRGRGEWESGEREELDFVCFGLW